MFLHENGRRQQFDADFPNLVGDRAENRLRIALAELGEQHERLQVRAQVEEILRMNLAGHHRVRRPGVFEEAEQLPELADAHPFDVIDERLRARDRFHFETPPPPDELRPQRARRAPWRADRCHCRR